ncbi:MAG: hypothetical protein ACE5KF_02855 [Kiloniellaceae bacterium]
MTRIAVFSAMMLGLSACGSTAGVVMTGASLATLIHTDKTVADHALSWAREMDCSLLHAAKNEDYCRPRGGDAARAQIAVMSASLYCYRTLGGVSCYDRPDYTASSQTRVNFAYGLIPPRADSPLAALPAR